MEEKKQIDYSKKFKDLMGEESTYEFYLKIQNVMPKYAKKKDPDFFSFIIFAIEHLLKYDEKESISSLFIQSIQLYEKNHPDKKIENPQFFMETYHKIYKMIPVKTPITFNHFSITFSFANTIMFLTILSIFII